MLAHRLKPAYKTALSLIRPFGVISSVGVHNDPSLLSGPDTYDLNLRCAFGRCPVRAEFPEALEVLRAKRALFEGVDGAGSGFVSHWMDLEDAPEVRTSLSLTIIQGTDERRSNPAPTGLQTV